MYAMIEECTVLDNLLSNNVEIVHTVCIDHHNANDIPLKAICGVDITGQDEVSDLVGFEPCPLCKAVEVECKKNSAITDYCDIAWCC